MIVLKEFVDYGRQAGASTPTRSTTSVVHANGSAASRATNNVIRTAEAAYWRKQEARFSGNGVAPARTKNLASHWTCWERHQHASVILLGCNDLKQTK